MSGATGSGWTHGGAGGLKGPGRGADGAAAHGAGAAGAAAAPERSDGGAAGGFIREARLVGGPRRRLGRHFHEDYALAFVRSGSSESWAAGAARLVSGGEVVLLPPRLPHACNPRDGCEWSYALFMLAPRWVEEAAGWREPPAGMLSVPLAALVAGGECVFTADAPGREALVREALALLAAAREAESGKGAPLSPGSEPRGGRGGPDSRNARIGEGLAAARRRLDSGILEGPCLEELAHLAGLSKYRFIRAFREAFGLTPHAYLLCARVNRARRLIAAGHGLAEAACDSGFYDQSHMAKAFTRLAGLTPGLAASASAGARAAKAPRG